jgi:hypothetical protein
MALKRREVLLSLPLAAGAFLMTACSSATRRLRPGVGYLELGHGGNESAPKGVVLVAMPDTHQTREVWTGLDDELGKEYRLVAVRVEGSGAAASLAEGIRRHHPSGLVLMNNPTVAAYRNVQRAAGAAHFPPAVIVMTSFLDESTQIVSATGISYEVPLITVVTNLRKLIASPIERVGVILRAPQRSFVQRQAALARREQISVVEQEVSANPNASELKWALRRIKRGVDAIWILNDDHLLTPRLIADGWLPGLNERPFCPTIVGAASLVSPAQSFGTFAVLPDHAALGVQAAALVFDIADSGWTVPPDTQVQLPLSTTTTVDLIQARERFSLREDALRQVDHILDR